MLTEASALSLAGQLHSSHIAERSQLDYVRRYWKGRQALPTVIPSAAPREVRVMARIARVNVIQIVVDSLAQSTFVDGFRAGNEDSTDTEVWATWQANKLDARQTGIHRATFAYGAAYAVVLPGDPVPVIRGASPRALHALYGDDEDWPVYALERRSRSAYRLYDADAIYALRYRGEPGPQPAVSQASIEQARVQQGGNSSWELVGTLEHGAGVCPVVRYLDEHDLDIDDEAPAQRLMDTATWEMYEAPARGQVSPLMPVQDQIDLTTFGLLTAQWYGAFRQRYAIGWVAEDEKEKAQAAASQLWTFDREPDEMQLGEFQQTELDGYIKSREASMRHSAALSQTPAHELIGELVNLSAEALAAAEAGRDRKVDEKKTVLGESHEQTLRLAGELGGQEVPDGAQCVWRDTSARAFSATVDALGKLATMLGVPPQELWERIPGVTRQDVERWRAAFESGDAFAELSALLERQAPEPPEV